MIGKKWQTRGQLYFLQNTEERIFYYFSIILEIPCYKYSDTLRVYCRWIFSITLKTIYGCAFWILSPIFHSFSLVGILVHFLMPLTCLSKGSQSPTVYSLWLCVYSTSDLCLFWLCIYSTVSLKNLECHSLLQFLIEPKPYQPYWSVKHLNWNSIRQYVG